MAKVVIDVSISLDGFVAGPGDGRELPLGGRGGEHIFDWYFSGDTPYEGTMFTPKGVNQQVVAEMFQRAVAKAKALAKDRDVGISGASAAQQALKAGLVDELYLHISPILLGDGVRLFEDLGD